VILPALPGTIRFEVPPTEVMGVRYTIECSLPQAARMCRQEGHDH
jgi:hypothetical protein